MKHYSLTSTTFTGEVTFVFNDDGLLQSFDQSGAGLSEAQQVFLLRQLPRDLPDIEKFLKTSPTAVFTEIKQNITFEMFWDKYNEKIRSSKKRTQRAWQRLKATDQVRAYNFILKYESSLYPGTQKKYAETYLNAELWNN
ncbi:MAG: hypothetical protein KGZ82_10725 [Bacteroidales bacterium]|nr:hypothetical protein [Bacteroidales bacterium]